MTVIALDPGSDSFPPVSQVGPDGLLAIGGDLSTVRLLQAYRNGIFPWYDEPPICWWYPDPRFVLFPRQLKISKSLRPLLNRNAFRFTVNTAFEAVIENCRTVKRQGQNGTWINPEILRAYCRLHELGYGHSAEVWLDDRLVGGLYGIRMGQVFFGESMFSLVPSASRYAFTKYVQLLIEEQVQLIDCQVYSDYLKSMGACMITGTEFSRLLEKWVEAGPA